VLGGRLVVCVVDHLDVDEAFAGVPRWRRCRWDRLDPEGKLVVGHVVSSHRVIAFLQTGSGF
jgi:hypothetical protein